MNTGLWVAVVAFGAGLGLAGCQRAELTGPPELRLGRDQCVECGMIINEDRFSSASLVQSERGYREHLLFDDVGCMLDYEREWPDLVVLERFAHDARTRDWLGVGDGGAGDVGDVGEAVFLLSESSRILTPMGSGISAYGDRAAAARAQAEVGGEILSYAELAPLRQAWVADRMGAWDGGGGGSDGGGR